jgi:hypothetical protein
MSRMTPFERDFADLHGRRAREPEIIRHEDVRAGRLVTRIDHPGARLVLGSLGLFWAIVLGVLLLAALGVLGAVVAGALDPAQLGG